jgi:hypothetical protein
MGASKPISPAYATPQAVKLQPFQARDLNRAAPEPQKNLSPSEFAGLLREQFGVLVSLRWVHFRCRSGHITTIRVPHFGRRLIPATEAARFAASIAATETIA